MKKPWRKNGFTLLEVMAALSILAVALVSILQASGQGLKLTEASRFNSRAVFLARQVLANAQADTTLAEGILRGGFEEPMEDMAWERQVSPLSEAASTGIYRVVVRVYPAGGSVTQGVDLTGFILRGAAQ